MTIVTDQLGRRITLNGVPKRIVSLVPSQTELLFDLGLSEEVIGITKFCIHPQHWFNSKKKIGGTKSVNIEAVRSLRPDLIIANKEENTKDQITALEKIAPVWVSDISDLEQALEMIVQVGQITGKMQVAAQMATAIEQQFFDLKMAINADNRQPISTAYLIWNNPFMAAGGDTFIHQMLIDAGCKNVFAQTPRYPTTTITQLIELQTELVLLSSEPFPFNTSHIKKLQEAMPKAKIILVDGEYFSWYGSRLLHTPAYLRQLQEQIHG